MLTLARSFIFSLLTRRSFSIYIYILQLSTLRQATDSLLSWPRQNSSISALYRVLSLSNNIAVRFVISTIALNISSQRNIRIAILIIAVWVCLQSMPIDCSNMPSCSRLYGVVSLTTYPRLSARLVSLVGEYSLLPSIRYFLITYLNYILTIFQYFTRVLYTLFFN